ncbi:hypothetical protein A8U91_01705 [Halomonas elongata]|uniref:Uncharacterized protein n=1 Tax=Halomonas elongata TaxID=2746 RepID=A0A1B8P503_HALEL|nr:hypothetical protein A8U91_01705 [Halomonas elongata]
MFQRLHIIAVGCLATLSMNSVGADTGMGEDKCMELTLAKSNLDLAMVGKARWNLLKPGHNSTLYAATCRMRWIPTSRPCWIFPRLRRAWPSMIPNIHVER